ncbi:hypothetical protein ALC62_04348 [Cyphomyrmex costatus]|uniref:Endonuclease/exonuclease/phosphatase domain-containing protein n=1 Tax=Cyphomyrmex costatus TaxID=456900 RepID=A0A151IKC0_9HYME|nr:hypothetical protein ALC62_04348 [Cyphomyrmex costatus]
MRQAVKKVLKKIGEEKNLNVVDAFKIRNEIIVAKISSTEEKSVIMRNRVKLRGTNVYIDDDLTKYERERQNRLRVWANDRRKDGMNARVKYGTVVMNGKEYVWDDCEKRMREKGEKHKKTVGVKKNKIIGIFLNVAGVKNKRTEFWKYIEEFDIVGLLETWVDEKEWENMKQRLPKGWKWRYQEAKREKKKNRAMGEIITGVREGIEEVDIEEREGIQERRIKVEKEKWRIISVYNREGKKEKLEQLKEMIREEEEGNLIIAGDFNARIGGGGGWEEDEIDKIEEGRKSKDCKVNKEGKELIKMIEERGWLVEKEGNGHMKKMEKGRL